MNKHVQPPMARKCDRGRKKQRGGREIRTNMQPVSRPRTRKCDRGRKKQHRGCRVQPPRARKCDRGRKKAPRRPKNKKKYVKKCRRRGRESAIGGRKKRRGVRKGTNFDVDVSSIFDLVFFFKKNFFLEIVPFREDKIRLFQK